MFQFDLGGGQAIIRSKNTYNDGNWHTLKIDRSQREAKLTIDDAESLNTVARGSQKSLQTTDDVYFGGVDPQVNPNVNVIRNGFDGCLKDIIIPTTARDIAVSNKRSKGITKGCPSRVAHLVSFPSTKVGYIGLQPISIGANFDITFKIKTLEQSALLMLAADKPLTPPRHIFVSYCLKSQAGTH